MSTEHQFQTTRTLIDRNAAIIVLNEGAQLSDSEAIRYCKGKIAGYKVPKFVYFIPEMPRNSAGKISKPELRKQFCS